MYSSYNSTRNNKNRVITFHWYLVRMAKYSTCFLLVLCQFVQTGQFADRHLHRLDLSFHPVVRELSGLYFPVKCIMVFLSMGVLLVKTIIKNGQILHLFCARSPSIRKNGTNRALSSWPPWSNLSSSCTRFVRFVVLSKIFIRFSQLVCFASTIIFFKWPNTPLCLRSFAINS